MSFKNVEYAVLVTQSCIWSNAHFQPTLCHILFLLHKHGIGSVLKPKRTNTFEVPHFVVALLFPTTASIGELHSSGDISDTNKVMKRPIYLPATQQLKQTAINIVGELHHPVELKGLTIAVFLEQYHLFHISPMPLL